MMSTVGVYMIVKNEESVISRCIDSILPFADEVIVVDTGSKDRTRDIVSTYVLGGKVLLYDFKWVDDFSEARNFALSRVTSDYSFQIDADEVVDVSLSDEVNFLKRNSFDGKLLVNVCLLNIEGNGIERPIFDSRMFVHKSLNPVWRNKVHEKLYVDVHEGCESTIPTGKGVVRHKKDGGSLSNFGRYMEMYYRMLNEKYDYYGDGHFYYYFYLTNLWNDIPMCKRMLSNVFKPSVLDLGDDMRETVRLCGNVTEDEWFTMNAIAQPYTEYDKYQIDLIASRSLDNQADTSRYLASEWFVKHAGMEKFDPYMEKAFGIYLDELSKALRPKDYIETYEFMSDLYPKTVNFNGLQEYVSKLDDAMHNTLAVIFDVDGFDTTYHYVSRCFTNVMVVSKRDDIKLISNWHNVCSDDSYAINDAMYVKQIPSTVVFRNNGHTSMENFKAVFNHFMETNNHVRGYIGFKREYVLNGNEFSVNFF